MGRDLASNQETETVAKILFDRVFCVHGTPIQILTDRGANFESELFQEICRRLAVDKVHTTAYKPSTNGNIECYHSTLNAALAKWIADDQRDWDKHLVLSPSLIERRFMSPPASHHIF